MAAEIEYVAYILRERGRKRFAHFFPSDGPEHVLRGPGCWCRPDVYRICTQCDDDGPCWACDGDGIIPIEAAEITIADNIMFAHHYIPDDARIVDRT